MGASGRTSREAGGQDVTVPLGLEPISQAWRPTSFHLLRDFHTDFVSRSHSLLSRLTFNVSLTINATVTVAVLLVLMATRQQPKQLREEVHPHAVGQASSSHVVCVASTRNVYGGITSVVPAFNRFPVLET